MAVQGWVTSSSNARYESGQLQTTNYTYNDFGDVTGTTDTASMYVGNYNYSNNYYPSNSNVALAYDGLGRCLSMTDNVGQTQWSYDTLGRVTKEDGPWANDDVSYTYDDLDRLKTVDVSNSTSGTDKRTLNYDTLSRLSNMVTSVNGASIGAFGFVYQGNSDRVDHMDRPNGTQTQYVYESSPLKRFQGFRNKVTSSGANQSSFVSTFALSAFKDNYSHHARTYGAEASQTVAYTYTASSMLKSEITTGTPSGTSSNPLVNKRYLYDPMGNRTQVRDEVGHTQVDSHYNDLNQLTDYRTYNTTSSAPVLSSVTTLGYDRDGNQITSLTKQASGAVSGDVDYIYDVQNRLVYMEVVGSSKWEFKYDGLNRLKISRFSTWNSSTSSWNFQDEKRRVYDGMDVVQERNSGNAVTASVTRIGNIGGILARTTAGLTQDTTTMQVSAPAEGAKARVRLVSATTGGESHASYLSTAASLATATSGAVTTFYAGDAQGNVTTLTDTSGAVVGSYTYDAWGNTLASSGTRAGENPYRYSSKEQIGGYYSFGYRFYNAGIGRWLNRDPIRESGGLNLYGFVGNNPINNADEYGLDWFDNATNFFAGVGDNLTFGLTGRIRQGMGTDGMVNRCSGYYKGGQVAGTVLGLAEGAGAAVTAVKAIRAARAARSLAAISPTILMTSRQAAKAEIKALYAEFKAHKGTLILRRSGNEVVEGRKMLGGYDPKSNTIILYKNSDLGILAEELLHFKQAKELGLIGKKLPESMRGFLESDVIKRLENMGFVKWG